MRQRGGGAGLFALWALTSAAGFLTHYFFVFPWLAIVGYLLIRPARLKRHQLALCVLATALLILPWYIRVPESLAGWRITKDWLKSRPLHLSRLVALRDNVLQFFYGHDRRLWLGRRVWNMPPFLLFCSHRSSDALENASTHLRPGPPFAWFNIFGRLHGAFCL